MIIKSLKIPSQNVYKIRLFMNTILGNNKNFNILFIQKSLWLIICNIPSSIFEKGENIIEAFNYSLWVLWQPLITKTNDHTSGKSLSGISSGEFTRELDKESLLN